MIGKLAHCDLQFSRAPFDCGHLAGFLQEPTMDMLRDHVAAAGIETEGLVIAGVVGLTFAETKTHYDGSQVDEDKRVVLSLGLRSEERRVGEECAGTCRYGGSPIHIKRNNVDITV